uniref:Uncharacterized protein n=1 Tax=Solanum lycopersicum TaxID=4081 RepID=A0A3Q7FA54_SOLLC
MLPFRCYACFPGKLWLERRGSETLSKIVTKTHGIERVDGDLDKWIDTGSRETRAVRGLHHSVETIWSELPWQSHHLLLKLMGIQMDIVRFQDDKRLFLGIDDCRQDVGRIGLAFSEIVFAKNFPCASRVSFKIVNIESEDDILCTCASPSLMLLLSSGVWHSSEFP